MNHEATRRVADALAYLCEQAFGGKAGGRYRISRKFLRQLADRRGLPPRLLEDLGDEMFERGYVFIPVETYFVVTEQKTFNSYRRVTAAAAEAARAAAHDIEAGTE